MEWIAFLGEYYGKRRKTEPGYKYKDAMTDARPSFYAQSKNASEVVQTKKKRGKKRGKKNRTSNKR